MPIKNIDAQTLKQWLDAGEVILIDVREPDEHKKQNIPGALLVPLSTISISNLLEIKDKKLVLHCKSGKRGGSACEKLLTEDPTLELFNLEGGITSWIEHGNPTNTSSTFFLPLNQ